MSTIAERVAAGAAFLDEHDPDWWRADAGRAIDLGKLNMGHGSHCILGQRCPPEPAYGGPGRYYFHAATLSGTAMPEEGYWLVEHEIAAWAVPLGFDDDPWADEYKFGALTAEWTRVITERRAAS